MAKIKKDISLRKAILQAAITGQLISDVEGVTETGKQLLDRIIEERNAKLLAEWEEALKKNPKAKKPTPVVASEISEDEIPFEIPENWCWYRLGDVSDIKSSKRVFEKDYVLKGIPFFRSAEIGDLQQNKALKTELFISERHFEELKKSYGVPQKGDLLITSVGTIGNTWISDGRNFYYKDGNITQISKNDFIIPEFYRLFINSPIFTMQIFDTVAGTAYNALTIIKLKNLFFPLPPLAVQNAIVAKLEQVLLLVDVYENAVLQKEELKTALPDKVKKAILQEAITGKLTETWRKTTVVEETGKQLLDRIIEERNKKLLAEWEEKVKTNPKAKKPTPIVASEIEEDEIPFEIPESWCWCRLGDVVYKLTDGTHRTPKYVEKGVPFLSVKNLSSGKIDFSNIKYITEEEHEELYKRCNPEKGDMLLTKVGTTGIPVINDSDIEFSLFVSVALIKFPNHFIESKYFLYLLKSPLVQEQAKENTRGVGNKNWVMDAIANTILVLPPLAEQKRIVDVIEQMLYLCEKLGG